jgi:hypothetical protein
MIRLHLAPQPKSRSGTLLRYRARQRVPQPNMMWPKQCHSWPHTERMPRNASLGRMKFRVCWDDLLRLLPLEFGLSPNNIQCDFDISGFRSKMTTVQDPPGFVLRTGAQKAAWDNGYRLKGRIEGGWLRYGSTAARGSIWIAGASERGPWLLSIDHSDVAAEIGAMPGLTRAWSWTCDLYVREPQSTAHCARSCLQARDELAGSTT